MAQSIWGSIVPFAKPPLNSALAFNDHIPEFALLSGIIINAVFSDKSYLSPPRY